jgi:predicted GNAT family acetyltransferase
LPASTTSLNVTALGQSSHPPNFQLFSLKDDAGGLWVAEEAGEILGFAWSWVCGDLWFLAQLFVSPGHQGRGIGNELLKRTFEHAEKSGATNRALITFTFNTVSQGLYIRNTIPAVSDLQFPGCARRPDGPLAGPQFRPVPLGGAASDFRNLAQIERSGPRCVTRETSQISYRRQGDEGRRPLGRG